MKRSVCTILMLAVLVLPATLVGVAQEGPPQADAAAPGWGLAGRLRGVEGGEATEYEPWVPPPRTGPGAVITVTTTDDELNSDGDCALREAIQAANTDAAVDACPAGSGDDTVILPSGTYTLTIPGSNEDGNQTGDLDILDNLLMQGDGSDTTVIDGGGLDRVLHILPGRIVEIYDVAVTNGQVNDDNGGGIRNVGGTLTLNDVTLRDNAVITTLNLGGGGLYNGATVQDASATLNNCLVVENTAFGGGGILNSAGSFVTATLMLNNTTVSSNTAEFFGGGIWHTWIGGSVDPLVITILDSSTVSNNTVSGSGYTMGDGGGLGIVDGRTTLVNSTVSGNEAFGSGLPDVSGLGGGIVVAGLTWSASLVLTNTTVADNVSNVGGGGIANVDYGADAEVSFKNSLIGGNSAPSGFGESCFTYDFGFGLGTFSSLGHNLEDYDLCEFDLPTDWIYTDPLVGPLADNGGDTWTHALLEGSLARDHGDDTACPPADQRGVPRPQGPHCDIGAFEAYPDENPPAVTSVSPPDGATGVALDATVVITFSEPISVPTFAYTLSPDPGGWVESWGPNDTVVSLTHDLFAYGTLYSATVTAAEDRAGNPLAAPYAWSFSTIPAPCDPVEAATIEGSTSLSVGETGVYSATYAPLTATLPVTLTWDNGTVGATASYSWTLPGSYTLTVTATNPCGEAVATFPVEVSAEVIYRIYLPVVVQGG